MKTINTINKLDKRNRVQGNIQTYLIPGRLWLSNFLKKGSPHYLYLIPDLVRSNNNPINKITKGLFENHTYLHPLNWIEMSLYINIAYNIQILQLNILNRKEGIMT